MLQAVLSIALSPHVSTIFRVSADTRWPGMPQSTSKDLNKVRGAEAKLARGGRRAGFPGPSGLCSHLLFGQPAEDGSC